MDIENEIYLNYLVNEEKLIGYGFHAENGKLVYERTLPKDNLKIIVEYDGTVYGKIIDLAVNEEYANFRRKGAAGYSAGIRQQFIDLLLDIREKCCRNLYFKSEQGRRINNYIFETYNGTPDFFVAEYSVLWCFSTQRQEKMVCHHRKRTALQAGSHLKFPQRS